MPRVTTRYPPTLCKAYRDRVSNGIITLDTVL